MPNFFGMSSELRIGLLAIATATALAGNMLVGAASREASREQFYEIGRLSETVVSVAALQHSVDAARRLSAEAASGAPAAIDRARAEASKALAQSAEVEMHVDALQTARAGEVARKVLATAREAIAALNTANEANAAGGSANAMAIAAASESSERFEAGLSALRQTFNQALAEARGRIESEIWLANCLTLATIMLCVVLCLVVIRRVVRPIRSQVTAMRKLAAGDVDVAVEGAELSGEIGDMARSIKTFSEAIRRKQTLEAEAAASRSTMEDERSKKEEQDKYYIEAHEVFMKRFTEALERLASGELKFRLEKEFIAEYEGIRHAFNSAAGKISEAIVAIVGRAIEIRGGTDRILAAADELSRHTEEQASSLEETSASMEQMAATIRQNASNAQEASAVANVTRDLASAGGQVASKAVNAMEKIERSSRQMTEIVGLIEEIAFQTNILALNAAVEAARAGDAGKGFAVVANEVRALSQRSTKSLKEIKSLIDSSTADVAEGVSLVKMAGGSLTEIVNSVKKASDLVAEIAAASHEQAAGVDQVSRAVANMDEMTQQNAALVQETTASLHTAQTWIQELHRVVSVFDAGADVSMDVASTARSAHDNWVRDRQSHLERQLKSQRAAHARPKVASSGGAAGRAADIDREWREL